MCPCTMLLLLHQNMDGKLLTHAQSDSPESKLNVSVTKEYEFPSDKKKNLSVRWTGTYFREDPQRSNIATVKADCAQRGPRRKQSLPWILTQNQGEAEAEDEGEGEAAVAAVVVDEDRGRSAEESQL